MTKKEPVFNFGCKGKGRAFICQFEMKECGQKGRINFLVNRHKKGSLKFRCKWFEIIICDDHG